MPSPTLAVTAAAATVEWASWKPGDGGHDIADVTEHLVHQPVHIGVGVAELGGGQQQGPQGGVLLKVGVQGGLHPGHGHPLLLKDEFFQGGQAAPHVGGAGQGHGEEIVWGGARRR